jgi:hypothetical protein
VDRLIQGMSLESGAGRDDRDNGGEERMSISEDDEHDGGSDLVVGGDGRYDETTPVTEYTRPPCWSPLEAWKAPPVLRLSVLHLHKRKRSVRPIIAQADR